MGSLTFLNSSSLLVSLSCHPGRSREWRSASSDFNGKHVKTTTLNQPRRSRTFQLRATSSGPAEWSSQSSDVRFHSLQNLSPLIKWLPREAWIERVSESDSSVKTLELTRPLRESEQEECKKLAEEIYILGCEDDSFHIPRIPNIFFYQDLKQYRQEQEKRRRDLELSPDVYDTFESHGIIPLPNLDTYIVRTEADFNTIHRVVGPKISSLEFASEGYKPAVFTHKRPSVISFPRTLRSLQAIDYDSSLSQDLFASLDNSLLDMPNLEILRLPRFRALSDRELNAVLSLPALRDLYLGLLTPDHLLSSTSFAFSQSEPQQRLRRLGVTVDHLDDCYEFLKMIGRSGISELQSLEVNWRGSKINTETLKQCDLDVTSFLDSLANVCPPSLIPVIKFLNHHVMLQCNESSL